MSLKMIMIMIMMMMMHVVFLNLLDQLVSLSFFSTVLDNLTT